MKTLKALEILKFLKDGKNLELLSKQKIDEAIEELEALENRRCNNCKYCNDDVCCNDNSLLLADFVNENFCCNKWEVKNECS